MGTQRQKEILDRIAENRILAGDVDRLQDVGWTMTDASLCGLGQTAASAVLSAIRLWPEMFNGKRVREPEVIQAKARKPKTKKTIARKPAAKAAKPKSAKKTAKSKSRKSRKKP
jgi:hypothetical protein